jgi:hypothetical protein
LERKTWAHISKGAYTDRRGVHRWMRTSGGGGAYTGKVVYTSREEGSGEQLGMIWEEKLGHIHARKSIRVSRAGTCRRAQVEGVHTCIGR